MSANSLKSSILFALTLYYARFSLLASASVPSFYINPNNDDKLTKFSIDVETGDLLSPLPLSSARSFYSIFKQMAHDEKANLTAITWAHAVNSQQLLDEALGSDINMIEADIVLGKINNTGEDLPVMAHPPATTSDISLESFLNQIMLHNNEHADDMKGVKLDFKSIEVFEGSLGILNDKIPPMTYPIWLNADIIKGPVNQTSTVPVDPERFFAGCSSFEKAVLSIGWTTKWGSNYSEGEYTTDEIDNMVEAIKLNNVTHTGQPITFPVRAGIAANSKDQLHDLVRAVNETNESSLTIWSSQNDFVDVEKLRELIFSFGFDRVYLDVPDDLANKLDLGRNAGRSSRLSMSPLLNFAIICGAMLLFSLWRQQQVQL